MCLFVCLRQRESFVLSSVFATDGERECLFGGGEDDAMGVDVRERGREKKRGHLIFSKSVVGRRTGCFRGNAEKRRTGDVRVVVVV